MTCAWNVYQCVYMVVCTWVCRSWREHCRRSTQQLLVNQLHTCDDVLAPRFHSHQNSSTSTACLRYHSHALVAVVCKWTGVRWLPLELLPLRVTNLSSWTDRNFLCSVCRDPLSKIFISPCTKFDPVSFICIFHFSQVFFAYSPSWLISISPFSLFNH